MSITLEASYEYSSKMVLSYPGMSKQCWRGCGEAETLFYILWTCSQIQLHCTEIITLLSKVVKTKITPPPKLALLFINLLLYTLNIRT